MPVLTPLRLATWNLNHWRQPMLPVDTRRAAWEYLATAMGVQVALVQEAVPPLELERDHVVYGELAGHRNWGSAVVALDPTITLEPLRSVRIPWSRRRYLLENANPGAVAIARLTVPGIEPITLVSVYGVFEGSVVSSMLRVVADLVPLFDSPYGARVILGGDLNVSRSTSDPKQLARADAVIGALLSLGLVEAKTLAPEPPPAPADCSCGHGGTCGHIATWGNAELDHLFVSPGLAGQVTAMSVDPTVVGAGLSDHVPLVLDLALSPERTAHTWDEESFAEEIGRRHGPAAREVIEKLVNWADQKERELAATDGVRTQDAHPVPQQRLHDRTADLVPGRPGARAQRVAAHDRLASPRRPRHPVRRHAPAALRHGGRPQRTPPGAQRDRGGRHPVLAAEPLADHPAHRPPGSGESRSPGQGPGPDRDRKPRGADGQHGRTGGRRMSTRRPGAPTVGPDPGRMLQSSAHLRLATELDVPGWPVDASGATE